MFLKKLNPHFDTVYDIKLASNSDGYSMSEQKIESFSKAFNLAIQKLNNKKSLNVSLARHPNTPEIKPLLAKLKKLSLKMR